MTGSHGMARGPAIIPGRLKQYNPVANARGWFD